MAELHITDGEGNEHRLGLEGRPVTFGRSEDCDFTMVEKRASRTHCAFIPVGTGWRVVDNQSSNGTWLGGRPVVSARLQPGDEVEIGHTVISYAAEDPGATPRPARKPRRRKVPWGALLVPIVLGAGAYGALGQIGSKAAGEAERSWTKFARTEITRAGLAESAEDRAAILSGLVGALDGRPGTGAADRLARTALAEPFTGPAPSGGVSASGWEKSLEDYRAQSVAMTAGERVQRLSQLLSRYAAEEDAASSLWAALKMETLAARQRAVADRDRVEQQARAAADEGRIGQALDLWNGWLLRAPPLEPNRERELAEQLEILLEQARDAAEAAVARFEQLHAEGKLEEAETGARAAVERLRGTGYDVWVSALASLDKSAETVVTTGITGGREPTTSVSSRERSLALLVLTAAEDLTRLGRFADAAARLEGAAKDIGDATLREELAVRAEDLRAESAALGKLLGQVREAPQTFGRIDFQGAVWRVMGATDDGLLLAKGRSKTVEEHPAVNVGGDAFAVLYDRTEPAEADLIPAALLLRDLGSQVGYSRMMRRALAIDALQPVASAVHARLLGRRTPDGGYVAHPENEHQIITLDAFNEIKNRAKIEAYRTTLEKLVVKVEGSRQAKGIEKVRAAYAKLEKARNHALELINDTEKYFYPYRDRMAEYTPVSREVDQRVLAVREAWASSAKTTPKFDKEMEKLVSEAQDLQIEIEFLGGDCDDLIGRLKRVTQYLGQGTLTVQTFWETDQDRALLQRNDATMQANRDKPTKATKPEQRQVEITNEYRIMFGHRRAVRIQDQLTAAARGHSEDMARLGFFAHESPVPGKRGPSDRIKLTGYEFQGCSENIHAGQGSPQGAHDGWQHSSGHHRNLLDPAWTEMGTGQYGNHWTQNFAFRGNDEWE